MKEFLIRQATLKDVPMMLPLIDQLGYPTDLNKLNKHFETFIKHEGYGIAVVTLNNKIVGWIAWSKSYAFVTGKVRIRIEGIVVDKNYRGQKIGQRLIGYVEDHNTKFRPLIIELTSGLRRVKDGSHEFYKSLGYHNDGYMAKAYFRKEIE